MSNAEFTVSIAFMKLGKRVTDKFDQSRFISYTEIYVVGYGKEFGAPLVIKFRVVAETWVTSVNVGIDPVVHRVGFTAFHDRGSCKGE